MNSFTESPCDVFQSILFPAGVVSITIFGTLMLTFVDLRDVVGSDHSPLEHNIHILHSLIPLGLCCVA